MRLLQYLSQEINKMAVWFRANRLAVNISKTKYMIFRMRGKSVEHPGSILYDENEPNLARDPALITELERYHENHENKEC